MINNSFLQKLCVKVSENSKIDSELYMKHNVKRGLRDISGKGVVAGLTEIADVVAYKTVGGETLPCEGQLFYRGIDVESLVDGFVSEDRFGFEETIYLLLFGNLPNAGELDTFRELLNSMQKLPEGFTRDVILKIPSRDLMNTLAKSVLSLYNFDENPDDTSVSNVLSQCLKLISCFSLLAVYGYQAFRYYIENKSMYLHRPQKNLSIAENILYMLRSDNKYTKFEAKVLDLALVLHAEHGGGNNSTFTNHVVTSSGTDTYSSMAASLASLKGPKHGGANIKVVQMFDDMKKVITDYSDEEQISNYLRDLLNKKVFDKLGLIYGMGHAVYSLSDPRANVLKGYVKELAEEKGLLKEYELYANVERLAPRIISEERKIYKGVSANVDFYSGLLYTMLGLPGELFTPIFAIARIAGWSAHRMEELTNQGKIIRPAYKCVLDEGEYVKLSDRD